jgi:hypothetical protein
MQWQVYTITVTPYDDTKTYDIVLGIRSEEYCIFSDIDVWILQAGSTNIGGAFAAAQIAGFNDQVVKFSGTTTLHSNQVTKGFN